MFHPDIQAALAKERHNTMLAEAAAARLATQARETRRHRRVSGSPQARRVVLRDGSQVLIRHPGDPQAAEIAVTIVDDRQRRGLGTELLAQLSDRARQEGIHRFTALVAADNVAAAGLLRNACASLVRCGSNVLEYEIAWYPAKSRTAAGAL
jgi:ribosomal protein S18 acetylase RimI-like enzyme